MTEQEIAAIARQHWKSVNPEIYQKMQENGDLEKESAAAARLTLREMNDLMLVGRSEAQAWQESRELFVLIDPVKTYNP